MSQLSLTRRRFFLGGSTVIAVAAAGVWWRSQAPDHNRPRLTVADAYQQVQSGDIVLIDVRTPIEWQATGVPVGGRPIDMRDADFAETVAKAVDGDRDAPIALICARGVRSARMTLALTKAGFSNIIDVPEGMLGSRDGPGWLDSNLPVSRWQQ